MENDNPTNNDGFVSRRKALATVASIAGLAAVPGLAKASSKENKTAAALPSQLYTMRQGAPRQFTTFNIDTKVKAIILKPGEKATLVDHDQPGIISRLWFTFSGWFWTHWDVRKEVWPDQTMLKKVILRIYWDGNDYPSVETPLGDFFGIGLCEYKQFQSKFLGMSSGGFYSYFPMPFEKIKIEVENMHDKVETSVFMNANYEALDKLPHDAGRFHCTYNAGTNAGAAPLEVLKTAGRGNFVGCCLSMQSQLPNYLGFLEAPEYIYIDTDGSSKPTIVGTGLEDYFNGGWYFRDGEFAAEYHGVPVKDPLRSMVAMYRFHEHDMLSFNKSIQFCFKNHRPSREVKFSSTAYWYQDKATRLPYTLPAKDKLADWYYIRNTDHQSIP